MGFGRHGGLRAGAVVGQVGEQGRQFFPGAGGQGLLGSLVELAGCDPADLEGFAQLAQCPVTISVADPHVTGRVVPGGCVHDWCSFGAELACASVCSSHDRSVSRRARSG